MSDESKKFFETCDAQTQQCVPMPVTLAPGCRVVEGNYKPETDWVNDPAGYFLIRVNRGLGKIEAGFCRAGNRVEALVRGLTAADVYFEIGRLGLPLRQDHLAYLGAELHKAHLALAHGLVYVQDEDISLSPPGHEADDEPDGGVE